MKVRDITDAIADNDRPTMREAFCLLVDPIGDAVTAPSPGFLVIALNRLAVALKDDSQPMSPAAASALGLPNGSTFAQGALAAKRDSARLVRHLMTS